MTTKEWKEWLRLKLANFNGQADAIENQLNVWFKKNLQPEIKAFIKANLPLAEAIVIQVAKDLIAEAGHVKFAEAIKLLGDAVIKQSPNVVFPNDWLGIVIQFTFEILRAAGKLPVK